MFYNYFNKPKLKMLREMVSLLLAASYITTFSSCTTTYHYFEFPESMGQVNILEEQK